MANSSSSYNRRRFLAAGATAAAGFAAWHGSPVQAWSAFTRRTAAAAADEPRILGLTLFTAAALDVLESFYGATLGLDCVRESPRSLRVQAGLTPITFRPAEPGDGAPWYHVAFNIPENKLLRARSWQLERSPLHGRPPGTYTLDGYPDVADFRAWNAHAIFFWDPAGNLLEYIARHDLPNASSGGFTSRDILYASEIGLIARDVLATAGELRAAAGLPTYRAASDTFQPIGDARGLVIVFPVGRDWGSPDGRPKTTRVYPTEIALRGERERRHELSGYPYRLQLTSSTGDGPRGRH